MTGENTFTIYYHHINQNKEIRTGKCHTTIFIQSDGKIKLFENWQWLNGDGSKGESILVEHAQE